MLYEFDYIMQKYFEDNFTVMSVRQVQFTKQLCQIVYYMGVSENTMHTLSIVWHRNENKPCILYRNALYLIPVKSDATLKETLIQMGFGSCIVLCEKGIYDMMVLMETPVHVLPTVQLNAFYDANIGNWWYDYWIQSYNQQLHEVGLELELQTDQKVQADQKVTSEEKECATSSPYSKKLQYSVTSFNDESTVNALIEKDHISYRVAMTVFE